MHKKVAVILIVILLSLSVMTACSSKKDGETQTTASQVITVEVEASKTETLGNSKELTGKLKPVQEITIIPKMPGKVEKVYVKTGQEVKKDDVLIELSGSDVDLQIAQAEAGYNTAKANADLSRSRLNDMNSQKKEIEDGIAKMNQGIKEIDNGIAVISRKIQELDQGLKSGGITQEQYEAAMQPLATQKASLEEQKQNLAGQLVKMNEGKISIENGIKALPFNSKTLDAQIKQAQAALDLAKNGRNSLVLKSPIQGVIASVTVEEGEMAMQTMPPVTIIDISVVILDVNLTELEVNSLKAGDKVKVLVDAVGKEALEGEVDFVSPSIDQRTQGYPARIIINNPSGNLKPGMFARSLLVLDERENVITVSKNSVIKEDGKSYVFVVNGETARKIEVQTGAENNDRMEILSGVKIGDQVVTKGQDYLKDNTKIQIARGENQ